MKQTNASRSGIFDLPTSLPRLQPTHDSREFEEGERAGARWARGPAAAVELARLHDAMADMDGRVEIFAVTDLPSGVYGAIRPLRAPERTRAEVAAFWRSVGNPRPHNDWLRGFITGALDVNEAAREGADPPRCERSRGTEWLRGARDEARHD